MRRKGKKIPVANLIRKKKQREQQSVRTDGRGEKTSKCINRRIGAQENSGKWTSGNTMMPCPCVGQFLAFSLILLSRLGVGPGCGGECFGPCTLQTQTHTLAR